MIWCLHRGRCLSRAAMLGVCQGQCLGLTGSSDDLGKCIVLIVSCFITSLLSFTLSLVKLYIFRFFILYYYHYYLLIFSIKKSTKYKKIQVVEENLFSFYLPEKPFIHSKWCALFSFLLSFYDYLYFYLNSFFWFQKYFLYICMVVFSFNVM